MTVLGSTFTLRSDDEPGHLRQVADYVTAKLEEVQRAIPTASPLKIAVLSALNIADELLKERVSGRSVTPPSDTESREMGSNNRLRWTFSPYGDLFVVYNHNLIRTDDPRWAFESNQLPIKVQYTWRF